MNAETRKALRTALIAAAPDKRISHDWANGDAINDWRKFRSVTDLANQLEQGAVVDPEVLICAAEALRALSKKTESAALRRRDLYWRDAHLTLQTGGFHQPVDEHGEPNGDPEWIPAPDRSREIEKVADMYQFTDVRGVFKAVRVWLEGLGR
jgi:hypothetical protein